MTKDEEGSLITTSDAARIVESSYLRRFSLYRAEPLSLPRSPFPSLYSPPLTSPAHPTSVMMNGVAGGGIYPEIYSVLGESISAARIDARAYLPSR